MFASFSSVIILFCALVDESHAMDGILPDGGGGGLNDALRSPADSLRLRLEDPRRHDDDDGFGVFSSTITNPIQRIIRSDRSFPRGIFPYDEREDDEEDPLMSRPSPFPHVQAQLPRHWWPRDDPRDILNSANTDNLNDNNHVNLKKTGTTIVGVCGRDYCVLGADTRATAGGDGTVADARARKLHRITRTVVAAGAGTSADLQHLCQRTAVSLALYEGQLTAGNDADATTAENDDDDTAYLARRVRVRTACRMMQDDLYRARGSAQAYLIVGGVDDDTGRATLRALYPHGSADAMAYTALGSGGYAATGVLENRYRPDLTVDEAVELVRRAVAAGISNDCGSGSQIDVCVCRRGRDAQYRRETPPPPPPRRDDDETGATDDEATTGVNGFGNGSFLIQRRRVIYDPAQDPQQDWRDVLELE